MSGDGEGEGDGVFVTNESIEDGMFLVCMVVLLVVVVGEVVVVAEDDAAAADSPLGVAWGNSRCGFAELVFAEHLVVVFKREWGREELPGCI